MTRISSTDHKERSRDGIWKRFLRNLICLSIGKAIFGSNGAWLSFKIIEWRNGDAIVVDYFFHALHHARGAVPRQKTEVNRCLRDRWYHIIFHAGLQNGGCNGCAYECITGSAFFINANNNTLEEPSVRKDYFIEKWHLRSNMIHKTLRGWRKTRIERVFPESDKCLCENVDGSLRLGH